MSPDFDMLTERQFQVLCAIREYIEENGYPPTIRELSEVVGTSSTSTVHSHLNALRTKGFLEIKADSPRALKVVK